MQTLFSKQPDGSAQTEFEFASTLLTVTIACKTSCGLFPVKIASRSRFTVELPRLPPVHETGLSPMQESVVGAGAGLGAGLGAGAGAGVELGAGAGAGAGLGAGLGAGVELGVMDG